MVHYKFYIITVIRVAFIALTCMIIAYFIMKQTDLYVAANFILLLVIQMVMLLTYINRINSDLTYFFGAISSDDSSILYKKVASSRSFERLYELFDQVNQKIQRLKIENAGRLFYLHQLVENAGIGIMSYTVAGNIDILNPAAKNLLNITPLKEIRYLDDLDPMLADQFRHLKKGEQQLVKFKTKDELLPLSVRLSEFIIQGETIRLLTIQNIKNELEENELLSWQKLIRTLTHEIMNSVGPISSTIKTIRSFYAEESPEASVNNDSVRREMLADTVRGLDIIDDRARGMLEFVQKFRSLTTIPVLNLSQLRVMDLLKGIELLFKAEIQTQRIQLSVNVSPESLAITVDKQLIEQVLINLVTNSVHALAEQPEKIIAIAAFIDYTGKSWIEVTDNGQGISEEISDKIFVPFFTTRGKGSGIGLSLSRQIMRMHKGKITYRSVPGKETTFSLIF